MLGFWLKAVYIEKRKVNRCAVNFSCVCDVIIRQAEAYRSVLPLLLPPAVAVWELLVSLLVFHQPTILARVVLREQFCRLPISTVATRTPIPRPSIPPLLLAYLSSIAVASAAVTHRYPLLLLILVSACPFVVVVAVVAVAVVVLVVVVVVIAVVVALVVADAAPRRIEGRQDEL